MQTAHAATVTLFSMYSLLIAHGHSLPELGARDLALCS